jgi:hypothetical protein
MEGTEEKNKSRYLCIVRNIRNNQSKAWNSRNMNWVLLAKYFGLGSTMSHEWCKWLGIDPELYKA